MADTRMMDTEMADIEREATGREPDMLMATIDKAERTVEREEYADGI